MIYLSNFKACKNDPRAISIAASAPGWKGAVRKDLAPKLSTVAKFKKGEITDMEYIMEYADVIYSHDLDKLAEELDGHVLLCHCPKASPCHRLLLGVYLRIETGIEIEEIGGFAEAWQEPVKNKEQPMRMIIDDELKDKYGLHGKFKDDNIIGHWRELKSMGALEIFKTELSL